jgi:hypothetical protein
LRTWPKERLASAPEPRENHSGPGGVANAMAFGSPSGPALELRIEG